MLFKTEYKTAWPITYMQYRHDVVWDT